jgi:hypothetical protein
MADNITERYTKRIAAAQAEVDKYQTLVDTYSYTRLGVFLFFIFMVVVSAVMVDYVLLSVIAVLFIFAFGWLVRKQNAYEVQLLFFKNLKTVNENELGGIISRSNIYHNGDQFNNDKHYYNSDLDIFGPGSLFQLINRAATSLGIFKLAGWLNAPSQKEIILERQEAVMELGGKNDWKLNFQASILFANKLDKNHIKQLFDFLRLPIEIPHEKILDIYTKLIPYISLLTIAAVYFYHDAWYGVVFIGVVNGRITASYGDEIKKADLLAGKMGKTLAQYAAVFRMIETESFTSAYCVAIADKVKNQQNGSISQNIKALANLITNLDIRLNIILGAIFNLLLLWNVKQVIGIENWKRANQQSLEIAFETVAEFEALFALAGLHINYPDWCFPEIADGEAYSLSAKGIAHPLINSKTRVKNNYELNDTRKIDIITGSNMAGKSTFLRTLGINTVLALCGAPVCAESMCVSVITIISYMRIKDSLNESTSTFKAELDRLQMLLAAVEGDEKVYFLIDEMLRGTNSVDKYKGSKAVIEQLISKKGVGLVATHDLQIAHLEQKYPDYIRNYYFDIQVIDGEMLFDYKIKNGECKTFNASLLLKQIGIDVDAEG